MLHPSKSQAILQWFNALTTNVNVESLSQFADGSLFRDIVASVYYQAEIENPVPRFTLADCSVVLDKSASPSVKEGKEPNETDHASMEEIDVGKVYEMPDKIDMEESSAQVNRNEIEKKYEIIEKFIDTFFQIQSSTLVAYQECMGGKDLELAKVAVMILSAMVQNFLSTYNEALQTITHLDGGVQEDIKECLSLLLERDDRKEPLTRAEMHKVLGKASKYKATPRRKTSHRGTPIVQKASSAKRGERVSTIIYEDIQDSPLKGLLQSPNNSQHRIAVQMFKKETELFKFRNAFHAEEAKVFDLIMEKRNLDEDLTKKREELKQLKLEFRQFQEISEEKEGLASMERAQLLSKIESLNKMISEQDDEIKSLNTEKNDMNTRVSDLEKKLASSVRDAGDQVMVAEAMRQMRETQQENMYKEGELQECKTKIETLSADLQSYKQLYEEGLIIKSEGPSQTADTPTRIPEVVSNIYNADAEKRLREKEKELNEKEEKLNKYENEAKKTKCLVSSLKSQLKEKTDNMKAIFDKMSILQEQCDSLLNKTKNCHKCCESESVSKEIPENSVPNTSLEIGSLWNTVIARENLPKTRSRTGMTNSVPITPVIVNTITVNPLTIERLKIVFRQFFKLIARSKVVEDECVLQEICALTREVATLDDVVQSFEKTVSVLKKVLPRFSQVYLKEIKALQESTQNERHVQEHQQLQVRLEEKENELKATEFKVKAFEEKMKHTKYTAEKQIEQLKNESSKLKKEYESALQTQEKLKEDKKIAYKKYEKLKILLKHIENEVKPCDNCKLTEKRLKDATASIQNLKQNEDNQKLTYLTMEDKVHNLKEKVEGLEKENKELKRRVQYRMGYQGNPSVLMNLQSKNYQQLGESINREEKEKALVENESQPVISVNTYILPRDQWKKSLNQSVTSNFGNRSQKNLYLLNDDEEDFLNHSSLAQIQNGPCPETPNSKERLTELQRRNTFCPPHLQSSYPLEIQNMTPSERKYSMVPPRRVNEPVPSTSAGVRTTKRKTSEMDASRQSPSKRRLMGMAKSSRSMAKPTTPLGKIKTSLVSRASFRTPNSIRRLISIHGRKSKMQ